MTVGQQLNLLLDEQDAVEAAQIETHGPTLCFARQNLQEMTVNPVPLPNNVADEWVWYFYKAELAKEIDLLSRKKILPSDGNWGEIPDLKKTQWCSVIDE